MATINYLSAIDFEFGAAARLEDILSSVGIARSMPVANQGIVAAGLVDRVRAQLPKRDPVLQYGTLNAVFLPAVLRFNANAATYKYRKRWGSPRAMIRRKRSRN